MKQSVFTLFMALTLYVANAQQTEEYTSMLDDGKVWILDHIVWDPFDPGLHELDRYHFAEVSVKRDTIVNGVEAKVVRFETPVPGSIYIRGGKKLVAK